MRKRCRAGSRKHSEVRGLRRIHTNKNRGSTSLSHAGEVEWHTVKARWMQHFWLLHVFFFFSVRCDHFTITIEKRKKKTRITKRGKGAESHLLQPKERKKGRRGAAALKKAMIVVVIVKTERERDLRKREEQRS